jgi:DNA ligase-1
MVFDCIKIGAGGGLRTNSHFHYRFQTLQSLKLPKELTIITSHSVISLEDALAIVDDWVSQGWEGGMLIRPDSTYHPGKRVHHAVKLKGRHTADLLCIGTTDGEGKYQGMIGSLTLRDKAGRVVNVGSGLCDADRNSTKDEYIGKVIEIQYERIDDTYIQPVYIGTRADKTKEEID